MTYLFIRNPGRGNKVTSEPNWESSFADKTKILSSATEELGLDTSQSGTETILRNKTICESKHPGQYTVARNIKKRIHHKLLYQRQLKQL
jgi:hypothetical protein